MLEIKNNNSHKENINLKNTNLKDNSTKNERRIRKKCSGCCDTFTCSQSKNYDYCKDCELNGSRYSQNKCPECGDGFGLVKFKGQPSRNCKTCYLANQEQREDKYFTKHA